MKATQPSYRAMLGIGAILLLAGLTVDAVSQVWPLGLIFALAGAVGLSTRKTEHQ